jgi:phosphatidylglycerophosphatase A
MMARSMGHRSNKLYAHRVEHLEYPRNRWPRWVLSGGGAGLLRPAPGSWGTAVPALGYWLALALGWADPWRSAGLLVFGLIAAVLLVRLGPWGCAHFRQIDPGSVVLDEFAGFALTVAFVPVPAWAVASVWHAFGFTAALYLVFRATDTLKLPPARTLERLPFGWGILLDDVAAGVQANLIVQLALWLWRLST